MSVDAALGPARCRSSWPDTAATTPTHRGRVLTGGFSSRI